MVNYNFRIDAKLTIILYNTLKQIITMSLKRLFEDVNDVSCPICGAPVLKDARNVKKDEYFCTGEKTHNLTNNKEFIAFLISKALSD